MGLYELALLIFLSSASVVLFWPKAVPEWVWRVVEGDQQFTTRRGAAEIFQEEARLSFKEIARRWHMASGAATPVETVLQWLVSDVWRGKFEDDDGQSTLMMVGGYHMYKDGDTEVLYSHYEVPANRNKLFGVFARDCRNLFLPKFGHGSPLVEADWQTRRDAVDWTWMANIAVALYDEPCGFDTFKMRVLERLSISHTDFERWLSSTKRPLPKSWSD